MVSNKRHEEQANWYYKEIERIKKDRDYWRELYCKTATDNVRRSSEADVYKSILVKHGILGEPNKHSDETFMFEGNIYKPISYHLTREVGSQVELTVDFIRVKEGNNEN